MMDIISALAPLGVMILEMITRATTAKNEDRQAIIDEMRGALLALDADLARLPLTFAKDDAAIDAALAKSAKTDP